MIIKISRRSIIQIWLIILVILNLGFGKMTENQYLSSTNFVIALTSFSSIILFFLTYSIVAKKTRGLKNINFYLTTIIILWFLELIYTFVKNNYRFSDYYWLATTSRFFEVLLVYPIYYVLESKNGKKFARLCLMLIIINLLIRQLSWYLYNFKGITIFYELLFENLNWSRNGLYRCGDTALSTLFLVYASVCFCKNRENKSRFFYLLCVIIMMQYTIIVFSSRMHFLVDCIVVFYILEVQPNRKKKTLIFKFLLIIIFSVFFTSKYMTNLILSFVSINMNTNIFASSSIARIRSLERCFQIIMDYPLTGVGFYANDLVAKYGGVVFSDVGVVGTIANLGFLGWISVFGYLAFAIKSFFNKYRGYDHLLCGGILIILIIIDTLLGSAFVYQRIISVPFTLAFFLYLYNTNSRYKQIEEKQLVESII